MNSIIPRSINFKELVQNSNTTISLNLQTKLIDYLNNEFSNEEQQWYIANLYIYMHYHPTNDFPINLDNVFSMIGFANKGNAMKTIKNNFIENEDYKKLLFHSEKQIKNGKDLGGAGLNHENVMLNIDTFKNLCMLAKTHKGKEIRKYYVKLENVYNKLIKEEIEEKQKESEELRLQLREKETELIKKDNFIKELEIKPETEGFKSRESGELYCIRDRTKPGHYKIGIANRSVTRVDQLNVGSSTQSLELYAKFPTFDRLLSEKLVHHALQPFKIKKRNEWFYFRNDLEVAYAMKTIRNCFEFTNLFDIKDYNHFDKITNELNVDKELQETETIDELNIEQEDKNIKKIDQIKKKNKRNAERGGARSGTFKGAIWCKDKSLWKSEIAHNCKRYHLGYFSDEIDAAKVYNDFALFLNETENTNFLLNDIPGYKTVPRNIPELNKKEINENKTSQYIGVSYDSKRKHYVVGIGLNGKTYNLGNNISEIECAKLYNQQALYFNKNMGTEYKLNYIPDYITIEKDIYKEIQDKRAGIVSSKYHCVTLTKNNTWQSYYTLNGKKNHIGTFKTEIL